MSNRALPRRRRLGSGSKDQDQNSSTIVNIGHRHRGAEHEPLIPSVGYHQTVSLLQVSRTIIGFNFFEMEKTLRFF